jgi:hypothetical protein
MSKAISEDLQSLFDILEALQPRAGKVKIFERLARRLSRIADKNRPWSWRYIQGVMTGTIQPSKHLAHAVELLAAAIDGRPPEFVEAQPMQVLADPARVQAGSLILGQSKQCDEPGCTIQFVPVVPWQRYCPAHREPRNRK